MSSCNIGSAGSAFSRNLLQLLGKILQTGPCLPTEEPSVAPAPFPTGLWGSHGPRDR